MTKYEDVLTLDNKLKTYQRQSSAIEISKSKNTLNP